MIGRSVRLAAALMLPLASGGNAQEAGPASGADDFCSEAVTQQDLNACSAEAYRRAEDKMRELLDAGEGASAADPGLARSQIAFELYRDLHCDHAAAIYEGGSIAPLIRSTCLTALTEQRIQALRDLQTP